MKLLVRILFSIFFAIAIGVHIYYVAEGDGKPFWWHLIYFVTYAVCWWMIFSKHKYANFIYIMMAIFPFVSHVYYGYKHFATLDAMFWICILTCVMLVAGFFWINSTKTITL